MIEEAAGTRMYESKKMSAQKTIVKKEAKLQEIQTVKLPLPPLTLSFERCAQCCMILVVIMYVLGSVRVEHLKSIKDRGHGFKCHPRQLIFLWCVGVRVVVMWCGC